MGKNEKKLFIVLEEHLAERYSYLINKHQFEVYHVGGFGNIQIGTSLKDILNRVWYRNTVKQEYKKLNCFFEEKTRVYDISQVYFSNAEGYIAYNLITRTKKEFPSLELIALQHGVFEFSQAPKSFIRKSINILFKSLTGIYPIGLGFGGKIIDKYIVYNQTYKDFLVNEFNWPEQDVIINLNFLKSELYDKKESVTKEGPVALFLMQCLSRSSMCSISEENYLNRSVIEYLSKRFDKVLIKKHPANTEELIFPFDNKVQEIDNLVDAFNQSTHAYSFSSTTLIEAKIFDIEAYAINSKLIKEDKSVFKIFENVIIFEDEIIS